MVPWPGLCCPYGAPGLAVGSNSSSRKNSPSAKRQGRQHQRWQKEPRQQWRRQRERWLRHSDTIVFQSAKRFWQRYELVAVILFTPCCSWKSCKVVTGTLPQYRKETKHRHIWHTAITALLLGWAEQLLQCMNTSLRLNDAANGKLVPKKQLRDNPGVQARRSFYS